MVSDRPTKGSTCTGAPAPSLVTPATSADVSLQGEIDLANAPRVVDEITRCLVGPQRMIRVDLGQVTFMDCRGVRACLEAQQRARDAGYDLLFVNPQRAVTRLIEILDVEALLFGSGVR
jgi:anti-anti-sigma factor